MDRSSFCRCDFRSVQMVRYDDVIHSVSNGLLQAFRCIYFSYSLGLACYAPADC
jgi:hypothetical protein